MRRRRNIVCLSLIVGLCIAMCGCGKHSVPKPYGYFRITTPDTAYCPFAKQQLTNGQSLAGYPYTFSLSQNAEVRLHPHSGDAYWIDIHYPLLNADIHCSYKPVEGNLRELTDDAIEFIYKHSAQASAIPEKSFENEDNNVYGVFFSLEGNTASPYQFFLTDSTRHFFRGAVYANCRPNSDSLAPIFDYLQTDVIHLVETFQWQY